MAIRTRRIKSFDKVLCGISKHRTELRQQNETGAVYPREHLSVLLRLEQRRFCLEFYSS